MSRKLRVHESGHPEALRIQSVAIGEHTAPDHARCGPPTRMSGDLGRPSFALRRQLARPPVVKR